MAPVIPFENAVENIACNDSRCKKQAGFKKYFKIASGAGADAENDGQYDNAEYVIDDGGADNCLPYFRFNFTEFFERAL